MAAETLSMVAAAELVAMLAMAVPALAVMARQVLGAVGVAVVGLPVLVVSIIPLVAVAVLVYMAKAAVAQVGRHQSHPLPHGVGARDQVVLPDQMELLLQVRLLLVQTEAHLAVVVAWVLPPVLHTPTVVAVEVQSALLAPALHVLSLLPA
jgi:hypothetical protein